MNEILFFMLKFSAGPKPLEPCRMVRQGGPRPKAKKKGKNMRTLEIGTRKYTEVVVFDEKGQGNANHSYAIRPSAKLPAGSPRWEQRIAFQNGPIKEKGVNGVTNEDLIAIVIDRMRGFQSGNYACRDNALALTKLEEALMWLRNRTNEREARGVEGTHQK